MHTFAAGETARSQPSEVDIVPPLGAELVIRRVRGKRFCSLATMSVQPVLTDWNIDDWLGGLGLDQYVEVFVDNGYDIPNLVASLSEKDLDVMHVNDREHRKQLLKEAANVPADKPPPKPKRTRGASVLKKMSAPDIEGTAEGLTRLQLKLKVGSELKNDKVEITALPYITEVCGVWMACNGACLLAHIGSQPQFCVDSSCWSSLLS